LLRPERSHPVSFARSQHHGAQRLPADPAAAARTARARPDANAGRGEAAGLPQRRRRGEISPRSVRRRQADVTPRSPSITAGRRALSKGRRSRGTSRCRSAGPGIDQEMSRIAPAVSCPRPGRGWRAGSRGGAKCRRRHASAARDGAEARGQVPAPGNSLARRGRAYNSPLAPESAPSLRA
jgi:hypothetical protein